MWVHKEKNKIDLLLKYPKCEITYNLIQMVNFHLYVTNLNKFLHQSSYKSVKNSNSKYHYMLIFVFSVDTTKPLLSVSKIFKILRIILINVQYFFSLCI